MIHTTKKGRLLAAVAALLTLTACASGGGGSTADAPKAGEIAIEGEGVSLNEYGGAELALGEPKRGGSLRVGMLAPVDNLDPAAATSTSGGAAGAAIYGTLMEIGPDGKAIPGMAESMESTDALNWTVKLRKGVTFTDGTPFDAAAVAASIKRYAAPDSRARQAGTARQIVEIKVVDALTVELRLAKPSEDLPFLFTGSAGMVPSPAALAKEGKAYAQKPVGAGAFKVKSFQPGGDLVLERNPDYFDPELPYLDEIVMVTATDTEARLSALKAGSLDLAPTQAITDLEDARAADDLLVLQQPAYTYYYMALNLSKAPFDDIRFRKALVLGIDKKSLSKAVFGGLQVPATGFFNSNHPEYVDTEFPEFDKAAATKLIKEYVADGGDPSFELVSTSAPDNQRQASVMQQMLSDIGVDMKLRVSDQPTMISEAAAGKFEAQFRFIGITLQAALDLQYRFSSKSPSNVTRSGDPEIDKLIDQLVVTPVEDRSDLYAQIQKELTRWMPTTPTVQQVNGWIVRDTVGGFPGTRGEATVDQADMRFIWAK